MSHLRVFKWKWIHFRLRLESIYYQHWGVFCNYRCCFEFLMLGVWYDYNACSTFASSESVFNTTCRHGALLHCKQGNCSYWWKFLLRFLSSCRSFWFGRQTLRGLLNTSFSGSFLTVQSDPWKCSWPGRAVRRARARENRRKRKFSFITDSNHLFFFPTFLIQPVKWVRCCSSSPLVCEYLGHGGWSPVRSMLIQSWSAKGLNSGTSQTAWGPVMNERVFLWNCCAARCHWTPRAVKSF